jgi:hypothetical protein
VSCNEVNSDFGVNDADLAQSSILGPLLFLVFIDDIREIQLCGTLKLLAADATTFLCKFSIAFNIFHMDFHKMKISL